MRMMITESDFNRRKAELRQLYKRYKAGIVTQESLSDDQRFLLRKYYGCGGGSDGDDSS